MQIANLELKLVGVAGNNGAVILVIDKGRACAAGRIVAMTNATGGP